MEIRGEVPLESLRTNFACKKRLIKERGRQCEYCGLSEWMGEPLSLSLHHIDGNTGNNRATNLKLLCPNCHSQTPNYRGGGNRGGHSKKVSDAELADALETAPSIRQALLKVGLAAKGGNYARVKRLLHQKHN